MIYIKHYSSIALLILIFLGLLPHLSTYSNTIDKKIQKIGNELMCPVCSGQTVAESNSDLAKDMRSIIRKKLNNGESSEEIIDFFITKYGDTVLSSPPAKGINLAIWIAPILAILVGATFILKFLFFSNKNTTKEKININSKENEYLKSVDDEISKL